MKVPEPLLCPDCRLQRRYAWRNEKVFYFRKCDITGKEIFSVYSPESPYKVCNNEAWYSDKWNAMDYGKDFDFSRPFFEQFAELMQVVPLRALVVDFLQNCEFVNECGRSKNCYLTIETDSSEDCMYSYRLFYSKTSSDCLEVDRSERCYECIDCNKCFQLYYSQQCEQCRDSAFLFDCRSCNNCFGCVGLRQKQYYMFNKQLSQEEYESRMKDFDFSDRQHLETARIQFEQLKLRHPRKALIGEQNENVSGNYINESKDCIDCYDIRQCRDCKYCEIVREANDCMDYLCWGQGAERIYNCQCCGYNAKNLRFCSNCWEGVYNLTYCYQCAISTNNCFGCIGLQKAEYCILNKQYSKEEYEKLVPKIIEHMKNLGEWGEFFPPSISPFSYNETLAQDRFPLTKQEVLKSEWKWQDNLPSTKGKETITFDQVPDHIDDVPDTICDEVLACQASGENYRITKQELLYYKQMRISIPHFNFFQRHRSRVAMRNPKKLWKRECNKCEKDIDTSYSHDRPEIVYCEECYHKEVYG